MGTPFLNRNLSDFDCWFFRLRGLAKPFSGRMLPIRQSLFRVRVDNNIYRYVVEAA
jgi:hypothetical protein